MFRRKVLALPTCENSGGVQKLCSKVITLSPGLLYQNFVIRANTSLYSAELERKKQCYARRIVCAEKLISTFVDHIRSSLCKLLSIGKSVEENILIR